MSKREKWVRRFEVDESARHKNGFTIYKITSVLFPISSPEVLTIVSVWKRYSEVQRLHAAMRSLHAGLRLRGTCPHLPTHGYFKRFRPEVISERAGAIKQLLEFVADHQLLFTSTDLVNFLQTGCPEPPLAATSKIAPPERATCNDDVTPMRKDTAEDTSKSIDETDYSQIPIYHASDHDLELPSNATQNCQNPTNTTQNCQNPTNTTQNCQNPTNASCKLSKTDSFESLNSLESISSDLYSELEKLTVSPTKMKLVLPDLINFDAPSTSKLDDYHTMNTEIAENHSENINIFSSCTKHEDFQEKNHIENDKNLSISNISAKYEDFQEKNDKENQNIHLNTEIAKNHGENLNISTNSAIYEDFQEKNDIENQNIYLNSPKITESISDSISLSSNMNTLDSAFPSSSRTSQRLASLSNAECKTRTEDSYVFEAGYMLNLGARYEASKEHQKAFDCYKAGIERMLLGVQTDADPNRRLIIKKKTNKYLTYAENVYKNHLCDRHTDMLPDGDWCDPTHPLPVSMLRRPYEDLALYKVLAVLSDRVMLTLYRGDRCCYAMKVIRKIPNNLTEFDEYFIQNPNETQRPILPTLVPYMVSLISYIETENLIFLILAYAPGEKLLNYIKNYAKTAPSTPARDVNLENVFTEPKMMKFGEENLENNSIMIINENYNKIFNNNEDLVLEIENNNLNTENVTNNENLDENNENSNIINKKDLSVSELLRNSKTLLQKVEKVLNEDKIPQSERDRDITNKEESKRDDNTIVEMEKELKLNERRNELSNYRLSIPCTPTPRDKIPPSTICQWGGEILTAVESLHNCGVVCRDLHPSNILLGARGHVCLTYMIGYNFNSVLGPLGLHRTNLYRAPELSDLYYCLRFNEENGFDLEKLCDYWSFGAIMYELLGGVPLSYHHCGPFTSHTVLRQPDGVTAEAASLLAQLLTYDPVSRLGAGADGVGEIKSHPYFKHIDWRHLHDSWTPHNCQNT